MKRVVLILIILIPSLIYFLFELSEVNFKKMPHFGPKTVLPNGDTSYYQINSFEFKNEYGQRIFSDKFPEVHAIVFIDEKFKSDNYKIKGLIEYYHLKQKDIEQIDLFIAYTTDNSIVNYRDSLKLEGKKVQFVSFPSANKDSIFSNYFPSVADVALPFFIILVDENRNIRGYYNGNLVAEVKKMIQEYKHLKLKESRNKLQKQNKLEQKKDE